jgi:hypothetical protein
MLLTKTVNWKGKFCATYQLVFAFNLTIRLEGWMLFETYDPISDHLCQAKLKCI